MAQTIINYCYEHRMMWEPWIQSAVNFDELAKSLRERGYTNLPPGGQPIVDNLPGQLVETKKVQSKKTMTRPKL